MQLARAGGYLPPPRRAAPFVHAGERRRVQAPYARPRQKGRPNRARLVLVDAARQRARRGRPARRLRSATLDRRAVACVTRTRETILASRDGQGPIRGPTGHVQRLPGITV